MLNARLVVVREAVEVVLRHLDCLPPSDRSGQLYEWARDCGHEIERWVACPPTFRERNVLMERLLALHIEVVKLERCGRATQASSVGEEGALLGGVVRNRISTGGPRRNVTGR